KSLGKETLKTSMKGVCALSPVIGQVEKNDQHHRFVVCAAVSYESGSIELIYFEVELVPSRAHKDAATISTANILSSEKIEDAHAMDLSKLQFVVFDVPIDEKKKRFEHVVLLVSSSLDQSI